MGATAAGIAAAAGTEVAAAVVAAEEGGMVAAASFAEEASFAEQSIGTGGAAEPAEPVALAVPESPPTDSGADDAAAGNGGTVPVEPG